MSHLLKNHRVQAGGILGRRRFGDAVPSEARYARRIDLPLPAALPGRQVARPAAPASEFEFMPTQAKGDGPGIEAARVANRTRMPANTHLRESLRLTLPPNTRDQREHAGNEEPHEPAKSA